MSAERKDTASELADLIRAMTDGPTIGMSIDEISDALNWPRARVNERLCNLGSRVRHAKVRSGRISSIKYTLTLPGSLV